MSNLFERLEDLKRLGFIVFVTPHNQVVNGFKEQVENGDMPLITYTVEVTDELIEGQYYLASFDDSFQVALEAGIEFAEKHLVKQDSKTAKQTGEQFELEKSIKRVKKYFPLAERNFKNELILDRNTNIYFRLDSVKSETDLACAFLAWTTRFMFDNRSDVSVTLLQGMNNVLDTEFNMIETEYIYTRLGNNVNPSLSKRFVESGFDMNVLREGYDV